ncbi:hypothetical protein [Shouchella lonarensis]|uniref:Uncharacterized protein n=1 Tax=Shouchella lonarensis TaxID=1464122 RepID=A0A1G6GKI6_9BACI|nr:hypothetical protein [Shouchella lonarensis]SDB82255.1 hypothetical protein SAMN05421737_101162 [Shouchella lonarensis]
MVSRTLKTLCGSFEAILAIPILGGSIVIFSGYSALPFMLILHIVGLIFAAIHYRQKAGHICGIVTALLGWIPFLGWLLHVITAIVLVFEAATDR